jgi:hypothetical protein
MIFQNQFETEKNSEPSPGRGVGRRGASETDTWAIEGSVLGLFIGLIVGISVSLMIKMGSQTALTDEVTKAIPFFVLAIPPLIGAIFGISAGTLVGVGTPKLKAFPEQGRISLRP